MSPDLPGDIRVKLAELQRELQLSEHDRHRLLALPPDQSPSLWDIRAVAHLLHACHTGIEGTLGMILRETDSYKPSGQSWHADLLQRAASPVETSTTGVSRPAIISQPLFAKLKALAGFRHVVRSHYGHVLEWPPIVPHLKDLPNTIVQFIAEVEAFVLKLPPD